jgi:hypothetical protein
VRFAELRYTAEMRITRDIGVAGSAASAEA